MTPSSQPAHGKTVATGAGLMILLRFGERMISLASFTVLARLLRPDDYGLFALALSVVAVVGLVAQWGFDSALIQRRGHDRSFYDTAWTLRIVTGVVIAGLLCAAALPASRVFDEPRLAPVLYWLALANAIASFENIGTVDFLKTLEYRRELVYRLALRVAATMVAIALAFAWHSYWALVIGQVVASGATVMLSYAAHPYRPRLSLAKVHGLVRFTRWIFARNVLQGLNDHAANMIIGRWVGVSALGYFTFARSLADIATSDLYAPIRRALFPAYAAVNDDPAALKRLVVDSTALMTLIGLPVSVGIALVAPDAVALLLGDAWLEVIPLLQILAIAGCVGSRVSGAPVLFVALGRPDVAAKLAGFRFAMAASLLALGAMAGGAIGAAWATVAIAVVMGTVNWRLVGRAVSLSSGELWRAVYRPFAAVALMAIAVVALLAALPDGHDWFSSLLRLGAAIVVGASTYVAALATAWRLTDRPDGPERHIIDMLGALRKSSAAWSRRFA